MSTVFRIIRAKVGGAEEALKPVPAHPFAAHIAPAGLEVPEGNLDAVHGDVLINKGQDHRDQQQQIQLPVVHDALTERLARPGKRGGGQLAAEKLLELGCERPLFLRIGSKVPGESDKRGDGFESVFRQKQMDCVSLRLSDEEGYAPFRDFLSSRMEGGRLAFDGIFCVNDALAIQIRAMLLELGLRVPEDVQLIGFDGIRRFAQDGFYCSTIVQPVARLAETSVDLLLREDRSNLPSLVCLPVAYAAGGTTREP